MWAVNASIASTTVSKRREVEPVLRPGQLGVDDQRPANAQVRQAFSIGSTTSTGRHQRENRRMGERCVLTPEFLAPSP